MTAAPRPGWYPDPAGADDFAPGRYRWWDGAAWSDRTTDTPSISTRSTRVRSGWRTGTALLLGAVLFVAASTGGALWMWGGPSQSASTLPAPAPGLDRSDPWSHLDLKTRVATIDSATMTLPDDPYGLTEDPMRMADLDVVFVASATVHPPVDQTPSWSSVVILGRLTPEATAGRDLAEQGDHVLQLLRSVMFDQHHTEVSDVHRSAREVDGQPAWQFTARVAYDVPGLPSRYDSVTAVLVRLADGPVVLALSSVPNDADLDCRQQAEAALASLTLR